MSPEPRENRKRRRPALNCEQCRRSKLRCSRTLPCSNCLRAKRDTCTYGPRPPPGKSSKTRPDGNALATSSRVITKEQPLPGTSSITTSTTSQHNGVQTPANQVSEHPSCDWTAAPAYENADIDSNTALPVDQIRPAGVSSDLSANKVWNEPTAVLAPVTPYQNCDGENKWIHRAVVTKTRYFGQSHYLNTSVLVSIGSNSFSIPARFSFGHLIVTPRCK